MLLCYSLALLASLPKISVGPELREEARRVQLPIVEVMVFSDRAQISRRGLLKLSQGIHRLRLPDLPGTLLPGTLRVNSSGGRVFRVIHQESLKTQRDLTEADHQIKALEALTDRLRALKDEEAMFKQELELLAQISPRPPPKEESRLGKAPLPIAPDSWRRVLDFIQARRASCHQGLRALSTSQQVLFKESLELEAQIRAQELQGSLPREVLLVLEVSKAGRSSLEAEYFVSGAHWKPSYALYYQPDPEQVELRSAGQVQQESGEDWPEVKIALSTSIPSQEVKLPKLATWTLGERRDFLPRSRPRPRRALESPLERERAFKERLLKEQLEALKQLMSGEEQKSSDEAPRQGEDETLRTIRGILAQLQRREEEKRARRDLLELNCVHERLVAVHALLKLSEAALQRLRESRDPKVQRHERSRLQIARQKALSLQAEAEGCVGQMLQAVHVSGSPIAGISVDDEGDWDSGEEESFRASDLMVEVRRERRRRSVRRSPLNLGGQRPHGGQRPLSSDLPASLAGGLDFIYRCPASISIPSGKSAIQVPLSAERYPVTSFYEATPSLEERAYLKAEVKNQGARPILAGPVDIFLGREFAARGWLKTTGPGGMLSLPLGADEDLRLRRMIKSQTRTEGILSSQEIRRYSVRIEAVNYKRRSIRLEIVDQIPKSQQEEVEVKLLKREPSASADPEGLLRWSLKVEPGQKGLVEFEYEISHPEGWRLSQ